MARRTSSMGDRKTTSANNDNVIMPGDPVILRTMPLERMDTLHEMYPDVFPSVHEKRKGNALTKLITAVIIFLVVVGFVIYYFNTYVGLLTKANSHKAQIDTELQRRANLVPNLVRTMETYTVYENQLVSHLAEVRSELLDSGMGAIASGAAGKPGLTGNTIENAISRLLAIVERYPDLKASETFKTLMTQLAETEDRVTEQRSEYNLAAMEYNNQLASIPGCFLRYIFRLKPIEYFEAEAAIRELPIVELDLTQLRE